MWCPSCKADVAAEVAADNRRVHCATCGSEITSSAAFTGLAKTREARDLLERWATERKSDSSTRRTRDSHERVSPLPRVGAGGGATGAEAGGGIGRGSEAYLEPITSRVAQQAKKECQRRCRKAMRAKHADNTGAVGRPEAGV